MPNNRELIRLLKGIAVGPQPLAELYSLSMKLSANKPYATFREGSVRALQAISRPDYDTLVRGAAAALRSRFGHVEAGDWVALKVPNGPRWLALYWGLLMAGYNVVLLDANLSDTLTAHLMAESGAKALLDRAAAGEVLAAVGEPLPSGSERWATMVGLCTSGTTSTSRVFVYDGKALAYQFAGLAEATLIDPRKPIRFMVMLPFHHILGLYSPLFFLSCGATIVYVLDRTPSAVLELSRDAAVTATSSVPLFWNAVHRGVERELAGLGSPAKVKAVRALVGLGVKVHRLFGAKGAGLWRRVVLRQVTSKLFGPSLAYGVSGGGHVTRETLRLMNGLGYALVNGYGMTEVGMSNACRPGSRESLTGGVGPTMGDYENRVQGGGQRGELLVRGSAMHVGELRGGELLAPKLLEGGWFATGDIVSLTREGLYIEGRMKEVIIGSSGENVYPDEVEEHFAGRIPGCEQFSVLGVSGGDGNDAIAMAVRLQDGNHHPAALAAIADAVRAANAHLPSLKRVQKLFVSVHPLPLSGSLKTKRLELRRMLESGEYPYEEVPVVGKASSSVAPPPPTAATIISALRAGLATVVDSVPADLADDEPLADRVAIDSLGMMEFATFIEKAFDITIPDTAIADSASLSTIAGVISLAGPSAPRLSRSESAALEEQD